MPVWLIEVPLIMSLVCDLLTDSLARDCELFCFDEPFALFCEPSLRAIAELISFDCCAYIWSKAFCESCDASASASIMQPGCLSRSVKISSIMA